MEELNRRKAVVFTHPDAPLCCRGLIPGINEAVIEYGTDTTRTTSQAALFTGSAIRYPNVPQDLVARRRHDAVPLGAAGARGQACAQHSASRQKT